MARNSIIIDACTLVYYNNIKGSHNFLNLLKNLFSEVLIPLEIHKEFKDGSTLEPSRNNFLKNVSTQNQFYRLCSKYDTVALSILQTKKGIDKGEAEAVAQFQSSFCRYILSDDEKFRKYLKQDYSSSIYTINSLHVVALLDLKELINERNELLKSLYKVRKFSKTDLKNAYNDIYKELGISTKTNKKIRKTDLKKIGILN